MIKYKKVTTGAVSQQCRQLSAKRCNNKDIARIIETQIGIPAIRTMSVLNALAEVIAQLLADGCSIQIDGLGIIKVGIGLEDQKAIVKRLILTPSTDIKQLLQNIQFEEVD